MFYDIYKTLCDEKGVSCKRAAMDMGLSNSLPTAWKKRGLTPNADTLNKVAAYFGVTSDFLIGNQQAQGAMASNDRPVTDDDLKVALFGGGGEVTDEMWEEVRFAAEMIKERYKRKKNKND